MYLQPDGVTDADFTRMIEKLKVKGISKSAEIKIPGAIDFFHTMGLKDLPLENSLTAMEDVFCSDQTRANILSDVILNTRIGMSSKMKESIKKAKLIKFESGVKSIDAVKDTDIVDGNFENSVLESVSSAKEYTTFAKKMDLGENQLAISKNATNNHVVDGINITKKAQSFALKHTIHKWRSVEKNVAAVLECQTANYNRV